MRGYTGSQEAAQWSMSGARGSGMVSSDQSGAIYYSIIYIIIIQTVKLRCSMVPCGSMEPLSPGPWSGLKRNTRVYIHYTEKHALLVLFNSTTQTSERLLNSLYRVVLGGSWVVVSDP